MDLIWRRKKNWIWICHILRGERLLRKVIEGWMIGKRPKGENDWACLMSF